jgi:hypothetical protein
MATKSDDSRVRWSGDWSAHQMAVKSEDWSEVSKVGWLADWSEDWTVLPSAAKSAD